MEKEQIRERHARSLSAQRYDPKQTSCDAGTEQLGDPFFYRLEYTISSNMVYS